MTANYTYNKQAPGLWPLYSRAVLPKQKNLTAPSLPALSARLTGVSTIGPKLARYEQVCGFAPHTSVPITWPHILAFPLQLKLLTDSQFPLPLLGLVHLRNSITQFRPIGTGERLDIEVRLDGETQTDRGLEFDLVTECFSSGQKVWEETSTNLFRQSAAGSGKPGTGSKPELPRYPNTLDVKAPENLGRRYGKVSGDLNLIHLHALTAKAFGFPRAIAHGMWSKAHVLAMLEQQENWRKGPLTVRCSFKKPFFLPGSAQLNWQENGNTWDYQLLNSKGDAPHLSGDITWHQD
ncbi:MaoC/PaaZ C-terminal domain-containing protein [Marinobacter zhejiangensis]|uniref:MaoC like domain-containing protein n=1 Tax=Marinobacter zhejiangensis TaxID=488535 RepID=A0A1I4NG83_9GAMM|nr:MaoC/PaaZ C-terminal domain-containing protein [Marinobacter zhejiangensis]SFM14554.1 MaoC like domain-containing protein [Marinobacter zhejiangensis]